MKKAIYAVLICFIAILVTVAVISIMTPIETVEYRDGKFIEQTNE